MSTYLTGRNITYLTNNPIAQIMVTFKLEQIMFAKRHYRPVHLYHIEKTFNIIYRWYYPTLLTEVSSAELNSTT